MTNWKHFDIKLGMTLTDFVNKNRSELQKLSSEQKQKIYNFCQNDEDEKVTNEVELAILEGFTSRDGKVKMPEGNPSLFMKREYSNVEGDYTDTFRSEAPEYKNSRLIIVHEDRGQHVRVAWQHDADSKYIIEDALDDWGDKFQLSPATFEHTNDLADGYADIHYNSYEDKNDKEPGLLMIDNNLDGTFNCELTGGRKGISSFIKKLFAQNK